MSAQCSPPWAPGPAGRRRASYPGPSYPGPSMRVSDAERTEVADRLAKHYGEGRLDETEFNARLDRAMGAKTQSDLHGLFDDLPGGGPPEPAGRRSPAVPGRPRPLRRIMFLVVVVVAAAIAGQAMIHSIVPWLLLGLLAFLWLRHGPRRSGRP